MDDSANTAGDRFADVRWFDELDSTNSQAAELARGANGAEGVVVVADHQRAGRGRLGRRWEAAAGSSLLVSVVLPPAVPGTPAHLSTIAMALAASDACDEVAGVCPLLKWPNDLVVEDGKVGGILGEVVDGAVIVGLGLNVNWGDTAPPPRGVALDALTGHPVDRRRLLAALLRRLDHRLAAPPERLLEEYRARSATLGRRVRVELWAGLIEGDAVAITPDGHLLVDEAGRRHLVTAGDVVHVRLTRGEPPAGRPPP